MVPLGACSSDSGGGGADSTIADSFEPDTTTPDTATGDTATGDTTVPPDTVTPVDTVIPTDTTAPPDTVILPDTVIVPDTTAPDTATPGPSCSELCATVTTNCAGDAAVYASAAACEAYCGDIAGFAAGTFGDRSGNTIGCRLQHANDAASDPSACPAAGPHGGGVCGDRCDQYCDLAAARCGPTSLYASDAQCRAACAGFSAAGGDLPEGDTFACRVAALEAADFGDDPGAACLNAGRSGGQRCVGAVTGDDCTAPLIIASLPYTASGDTTIWSDAHNTADGCGVDGLRGVGAGDLAFSFTAPQAGLYRWKKQGPGGPALIYAGTSCEDGGLSGCWGTSGDIWNAGQWISWLAEGEAVFFVLDGWFAVDQGPFELTFDRVDETACPTYCGLVQSACAGADAQYPTRRECEQFCESWGDLPTSDGTATGNSVACRARVAARRLNGDATASCDAAGPTGGGVCGDFCDTYCHLANKNCGATTSAFASDAACRSACAGFAVDGATRDPSGDSVQCRLYYAGLAGAYPDSAESYCANMSASGGAACTTAAASPPGDTCATAGEVGPVPAVIFGMTSDAGADYGITSGECSPQGVERGTAGRDQVYRFVPEVAGVYRFAIPIADFDALLYVVSGCDDIDTNCLAAHDGPGAGGDQLTLSLEAGVAVYVIVDGWSALEDHSGVYQLTVEAIDPTGCDAYCDRYLGNCSATAPFETKAACVAYCADGAAMAAGSADDRDADTIGCRSHFALEAATNAAACDAAGPSGGGVCGDLCDVYCASATATCTGDAELYASDVECAAACAGWRTDGTLSAARDTVRCRLGALVEVGTGASPAPEGCAAAAADSARCKDPEGLGDPTTCATYCAAVMAGCPGSLAPYVSEASCLTRCASAKFPPGEAGDVAGHSVACRSEHARLAAEGDAALHCASAAFDGGGVCGSHCDVYCHQAGLQCPGADAITPDDAACRTVCGVFDDAGSRWDITGDSIHCRLSVLQAAAIERSYCSVAGVVSDGVCDGDPAGERCDDAITIGKLPFAHRGDSSVWRDDLSTQGGCDTDDNRGAGAPDVVFRFRPPDTGTYRWRKIGVGGPTLLYFRQGCGPFRDGCLGQSADLYKGGVWDVPLDAGVEYTFVLDGWFGDDAGPYDVTLEVAR